VSEVLRPTDLVPLAFAFMIVLARVAGVVMVMPGFGETEAPATVRAGLAGAVTILLLPAIAPLAPPLPASVGQSAAVIVAEAITGLWLGTLARFIVQGLSQAGQIMAFMIGVSSVLQPDPGQGGQIAGLARLMQLAGVVLLAASGLYVVPLQALAGSWTLVPPGTLLPAADAAATILDALANSFALALRLAAPFILGATLWQVAFALFSRLVPRLQVFFVSGPGQILAGLVLLVLLAPALLAAWQDWVTGGLDAMPGVTPAATLATPADRR